MEEDDDTARERVVHFVDELAKGGKRRSVRRTEQSEATKEGEFSLRPAATDTASAGRLLLQGSNANNARMRANMPAMDGEYGGLPTTGVRATMAAMMSALDDTTAFGGLRKQVRQGLDFLCSRPEIAIN